MDSIVRPRFVPTTRHVLWFRQRHNVRERERFFLWEYRTVLRADGRCDALELFVIRMTHIAPFYDHRQRVNSRCEEALCTCTALESIRGEPVRKLFCTEAIGAIGVRTNGEVDRFRVQHRSCCLAQDRIHLRIRSVSTDRRQMKVLTFFAIVSVLVSVYAVEETKKQEAFQQWLEKEIERSADKLLHLRGHEPLEIPIDIDVVLAGFDGDGAYGYRMHQEPLENLLLDQFELRRPVARETGEYLSSQYMIDYTMVDMESTLGENKQLTGSIIELEGRIQRLMEPSDKRNLIAEMPYASAGFEDWKTFSVEATLLEPYFDKIVEMVIDTKYRNSNVPHWVDHNVILIINPNKSRMRPESMKAEENPDKDVDAFNMQLWDSGNFKVDSVIREEARFGYYYTYESTGMSTTWISRSNYVVIDVTAGPVKFGQETAPSGSVSPTVLPRILDVLYEGTAALALHGADNLTVDFHAHAAEVRDAMFRGRIAAMIFSATNHIFLNDVYVENALDQRKIIIPLIVLRNHLDFSPFGEVNDPHTINGTSIQREVKQLVGSNRVIVTESLHSIHHHKALAVALYKSITAKSEAIVQPRNDIDTLHSRMNYYIDAEILMEEFKIAADALSSAWMEDASGSGSTPPSVSKLVRTLPVFILSLKGMYFDLTFQNNELVVTNGKVVIVLQTVGVYEDQHIEAKYNGHFVGGEPVVISTVDVERHILAGLTTALTGTPPPYELYDKKMKEITQYWLWSTGHTPFGPHSVCRTLSVLARHAASRNTLLCRLEKILRLLRKPLSELDAFVGNYTNPLLNLPNDPSRQLQRETNYIDYLYKSAALVLRPMRGEMRRKSGDFVEPPFPADVIKEVEQLMMTDLVGVEETLRGLGKTVDRFSVRVNREVRAATDRLQCCTIEYCNEAKKSDWKAIWITVGVMLVLIVVYISIPVVEIQEVLLKR